MKILMVYPDYENTFWGFKRILRLLGKESIFPSAGTFYYRSNASIHWEKKLVDMNTDKLEEKDIKWADYVFVSAMIVQKEQQRKL